MIEEYSIVGCLPFILKKKEGLKMKKREYNIRLLRYISLILLLLNLLVLVIKK